MKETWEYEFVSNDTVKVYAFEAEMAQFIADVKVRPNQGKVITSVTSAYIKDKVHRFEEDAAEFLAQYKRHHPMLKNPDPELQQRIRLIRYNLDGKPATAKDVWERFYRGQIDNLVDDGGENYLAALTLMLPCMDRVYTLIHPEYDGIVNRPRGSYWKSVLELFFPADGFNDSVYNYLNENLRVGVIHDAFLRRDIGFSDSYKRDDYSDSTNVFVEFVMRDGRIVLEIVVPWFWERVQSRIDLFYEHEQWISGWSMHKMLRLNPNSRPSEVDPT